DLKNLLRDDASTSRRTVTSGSRLRWFVLTVVVVLAVVLGIVDIAGRLHSNRNADTAIDSIAVLPLTNSEGDPDAQYLSDGISESLINSLSELPKLRVIPRTTAFTYKGKDKDPREVGRDLNVRAVLTGRLVKRADTLTVQIDLIDVSAGSQLWGGHYTRKFAD